MRKKEDADRLQKEFGDRYVPLIMDISDGDAVHLAAEQVGSMIGNRNLAGLVNNAGIVVSGPLLYMRPSEYRRQLEVNMISPLIVIQAFAPLLGTDEKRLGPTGRIVNITSSTAKVVVPLLGAYSSSKCGLEGMSDALRRELMLFGIDLVMIEPGTVNTEMYDKGEKEDLSEFNQTEYWGGHSKVPEVYRDRGAHQWLGAGAYRSGRLRGTDGGEPEGTLCSHSAAVQELDIAQTPSNENARRGARKTDGSYKAVIALRLILHQQ